MPNEIDGHVPAGDRPLRIGTRRSALALKQAHMVRDALHDRGHATEIVTFSTSGDERLDVPLPAIGGKGVFTAELEAALLAGTVDLCVHSLKDLPTDNPPGLDVGAVLPREDPRDALLVRRDVAARTLTELPPGSRVGTSSLRRTAMLRQLRPDLRVTDLRGNVPTRIQKLDDGQMEAILLAGAGLKRLGLDGRITQWLEPPAWLPAPAQGVIAIQIRRADARVRAVLAPIHDEPTWQAAEAERAFLNALDGGCQVPVGALVSGDDGALWLDGVILDVEGGEAARGRIALSGREGDSARAAGRSLASQLLHTGGDQLLVRARAVADAASR